jgi:hypothetical protein
MAARPEDCKLHSVQLGGTTHGLACDPQVWSGDAR